VAATFEKASARRVGFLWAVFALALLGLVALPASTSQGRVSDGDVDAGVLRAVATVSAKDVWAVGYTSEQNPIALIEHWDGESWSVVEAHPPDGNSWLYAVSASSSSDVWAAGVYSGRGGNGGYVEHWDGKQWSLSSLDAGSAMLVAISTTGPDDVWTASLQGMGDGRTGTVFHWDGASWSEVDTPDIGWFIGFTGIVALSPTDAWLVGAKKAGHHTIVEHWDGTAWRIVASRDEEKLESLYAVAASGPSDLWAVGLSGTEPPPPGPGSGGAVSPLASPRHLFMHSTGKAWKPVQGPSLHRPSVLLGVAAASTTRAWAVGFTGLYYKPRAIIMNWDGAKWTTLGHPGLPHNKKSTLYGVSANSDNDAWAVGTMSRQGRATTVIEHWDGSTWSRV
jgi:hypothetical protein